MKKVSYLLIAVAALMLCACGDNEPVINPNAKDGALSGKFSVSNTEKVQFSQGNLQYQASTYSCRFATNQWDVIGQANKKIGLEYAGWIDLFCWGTGGQPYLYEVNTDLYRNDTPYDWGHNPIANGGDKKDLWRTLTQSEWDYLIQKRNRAADLHFFGKVAGMKGLILLPDDWNSKAELKESYSASEWQNVMEQEGAVFLPAAGIREGNYDVSVVGENGFYWAKTPYKDLYSEKEKAYYLFFNTSDNQLNTDSYRYRYYGCAVRLVK